MLKPLANRRLQLATRIHFALKRELGEGIDVGRMLKHPLYARDVLLVCDACSGHDLPRLAIAYRGLDIEAAGDAGSGLSQFSTSQLSASRFGGSQFAASQFASPPIDAADAPPESVPHA